MTDETLSIGSDEARRLAAHARAATPAPETDSATPAPAPDPAILAAWLEGALDEAEAAPVERWIAADPAAPAAVLALRAALAADPAPAPASVVARAQAIVRAPARGDRPSLLDRLFAGGALRWGAVAALAVLVAYGGFEAGSRGIAPTLAPSVDGGGSPGAVQEADMDFGAQPAPFL